MSSLDAPTADGMNTTVVYEFHTDGALSEDDVRHEARSRYPDFVRCVVHHNPCLLGTRAPYWDVTVWLRRCW